MIYLTPFGYDPSHVISGIVEKGITDQDTVVLVIPEKNLGDSQFKGGKQEIEKFLDQVGKPDLEILSVDHSNFQEATLEISNFISEAGEKIFLNASQAAREILIATLLACLFQRDKIEDFTIYSNVDRKNLDAELPYPVKLTGDQKNLLKTIQEGITISELAEKLDMDKSTASRRIKKLKENHLVRTEKDGRKKIIQLSFTGKICQISFSKSH
ncbi:MAG: CRISPR-associated CARF protein Csa3 [Candidatus Nanohaloarchaea archaeon]|nr:CRISPR-associated CARF protein Csa3 [Candidatus Nanohaloarchaea archaeon]